MRITNRALTNNFINNLNRNTKGLSVLLNQLASGKEIEKPSDNPIAVSKSMYLTTAIEANEQYKKNIEDAISWNSMTDTAMDNIGNSIQRIREITVQAANESLTEEDTQGLLEEVDQLIQQIAQDANTTYDGRYLLAGQTNEKPPFEIVDGDLIYSGDGDKMKVEVASSLNIEINTTGDELHNNGQLSDTLKELKKALLTGDSKSCGKLLGKIDEDLDHILNLRSKIGARINRLESTQSKNEAETINMKEILSNTEDIDFAEKIMEYKAMENVYKATLSTGAKVIQPTLLDYLR